MSISNKTEVTRKTGHNNGVTNAVVQHLRGRIISGEFAPGVLLPSRRDLKEQFDTTLVTVQGAMKVLATQGFISAEGARGTFVSQHPPHTSRCALVFPHHPAQEEYSRFWVALREEAALLQKTRNRTIPIFYDVDVHCDSDDARRLLHEMQTHQLAGVIFASMSAGEMAHTPLLQVLNIPLVSITNDPNDLGVPVVKIDYDSFFDQALDFLASRGCRQIAAINPRYLAATHKKHFQEGVAARGLCTQPYWWLPVHLDSPESAAVYVQLLMNKAQQTRPDALIISDDNLVEHVIAGLKAEGIRVPEDLIIVAHSNFPTQPSNSVPMRRLGYSSHQVLATCLDIIDRQSAEELVPSLTPIEAVFESEIQPRPIVA